MENGGIMFENPYATRDINRMYFGKSPSYYFVHAD